jgi:exonuclease SbcD
MAVMRFVQLADTHLASCALVADIRSAFARACTLAVDREADVVLIPGDLFDYETVDPDTARFVMRALAGIAPIRVFIAPGNHDSLRPRSPYFDAWPDNVHIFKSLEFETVTIGELNCSITGIAHAHRGITDRLLSSPIASPPCATRILLFHGSRDGYRPSDKENVIPFSDSELISQGFTYAAVGHYHSFAAITDERGCVRGAYSGCAQGRGLDETGAKCVLVGEIDSEGRVELEQVEVADRRIVRVDIDVTGSRDQAEVFARIDDALAACAREQDVVHVFLKGMLPPGLEIDASVWQPRQSYSSVSVNASGVEPDYDIEAIGRDSAASPLRSAFVRAMLERQESVATDDERLALRDALYYGLYALDGRRLEPRDAD